MASDLLRERRESGYYRPDPGNLPAEDVLKVPNISEVLDCCETFEESHADDGVGSCDAYRHTDPHWVLYSLLAAVQRIQELEQVGLVQAWESGYAEGLKICKHGRRYE